MRTLLFSMTLLVSSNLLAADCYILQDAPTVLRSLSAPAEVCLSRVSTSRDVLSAELTVDGIVANIAVELKDRRGLGVHFDSAKAVIFTNSNYTRYCEELDLIALTLNVILDIDGSLIGLNRLEGLVGSTPDICHTQATSEKITYKKF